MSYRAFRDKGATEPRKTKEVIYEGDEGIDQHLSTDWYSSSETYSVIYSVILESKADPFMH